MTTKKRGLGLGLAITKRIVEQLGGTITVASELGKGTTFTMRFPGRAAAGGRRRRCRYSNEGGIMISRRLVKTDEIEIEGQRVHRQVFRGRPRRAARSGTAPSWCSAPAIASSSTAARWAIWSGEWRG